MAIYLDASALVKLIFTESESAELRRYLGDESSRTSSAVSTVELIRAARFRGSADLLAAARELLARLHLIELDDSLLDAAAVLDAPLRTLDAIHLASALTARPEVDAFVSYDARLLSAARELGLPVVAPGQSA